MKRKRPLEINYIFFGIFLAISLLIGTFKVFDIKNPTIYSRSFFLVYSYSQSLLEICLFAIVALLIKKLLPKIFFHLFIGLAFVFFITHIIDYTMLKIMDMTFWDGLDIALDEDLENFIEMLHTTGIPFFAWVIFGVIGICLPFLGVLLYKITEKASNKRKLPIYQEHFLQTFFCLPLAILIWDFRASSSINPHSYAAYTRALPWKLTFVQPNVLKTDFTLSLKKPKRENEILKIIDSKDLTATKNPNIFLFIIESLRDDFITEEIAPNLFKFKNENISFERSLANANATHHSWFSLMYSNYPYLWKHYKDSNWKSGATCLYILKKMGYDINVFSAPELKYYTMRELLFGKNTHLAENFNLYPHYHPVEACDSDQMAIDAMKKILKKDKNIYVTFLDSTHFLYSWPKDFETKFKPVAEIDYLSAYMSKENIDLIKNRYKNSIHFVDDLLGSFFEYLKEKNLFDDSIIIILGDHGEEFYEEGHLFHASHLSCMQTNIPIFFKLGKNQREIPNRKLVCHMDVFPSILDYIFDKNHLSDILKGESIFEKTKFPYVITTRYNASRAPFEFFIHSETEKLTLRFKKKKEIFKKQHLEIISLKDDEDKEINFSSKQEMIDSFDEALIKFFNK